MLFLGIHGGEAGVHSVLTTERGRVLARSASLSLLPVGEQPLAVGYAGLSAEALEGLLPPGPRWRCSSEEAVLAGALGGREGVLLWCGRSASVWGLEQGGRIHRLDHQEEGGALWLAQQALEAGSSRLKAEASSDPLDLARRVIELAEHPGPDPECRGLVGRAARRLSDLVRRLRPRLRFRSAPGASFGGPALFGALLAAFRDESGRYLPELRWAPSRFPPEAGCVLLAQGGVLEARRSGAAGSQVGENEWRHVFRMRQPLPEWT